MHLFRSWITFYSFTAFWCIGAKTSINPTNHKCMLEYNTTGVQTPSTDNLNTSYLVEFPISPSAICVILNDLSRRGSVIKPPLHTRTASGVGISKDAEQWFCPMLSRLDKSFADTQWKGTAWGISVIGYQVMRQHCTSQEAHFCLVSKPRCWAICHFCCWQQ